MTRIHREMVQFFFLPPPSFFFLLWLSRLVMS
ncbi:hypothetical protein LINGRAHAP2_LOCUS2804 [Linum grandiflorum]